MKKVENKSYKAKTERECGYVQWYDSTPGSHCCLLLDPYHDPSATATREIMVVQTRFASGTSLPDLKPKSTSTSISIPMQNVMNKPVTEQDSLYHICANVLKRLEALPQLKPFLQLAYQSSEVLSERQSLLLSQKQHQELLKSNDANRDSSDMAPTLRSSSHLHGHKSNVDGGHIVHEFQPVCKLQHGGHTADLQYGYSAHYHGL